MTTLYVREEVGYREAEADAVLARARQLIAQRFRKGAPVLQNPRSTREFLVLQLGTLEHEVFGCLYLDNRNRLICPENLFRGTVDGAVVHPREVVKSALRHNAAGIICYHNHPSGVSEPSSADEQITRRLKEALALVDIRLLDHVIVADPVYSFAEHGRL